jgi:hypothetical protein
MEPGHLASASVQASRRAPKSALHSEEPQFCGDFFGKTGCYFDGIKWFVHDPLLSRNR